MHYVNASEEAQAMIRILIVDDEPIERMALQRIIETSFTEVEIVGQASNGREAIESAELLKPDLITMDIKMPGINGLQAIERIKTFNDTVKFIVVTAFDTFEFARSALQMGVSDYLLKPSKTTVIQETIGKVVQEIRSNRMESEHRRMDSERLRRMLPIVEADIVSQLLFDDTPSLHLSEMIDLLGLPVTKGGFVINLLLSESSHDGRHEHGRHEELEGLHAVIVKQLADWNVHCWIGKITGNQIPIILFMEGEQSYRSYAVIMGRKLVQAALRHSGYEPFAGIGGLYGELKELRKSYHESMLASVDLSLPARFCLYEDLPRHDSKSISRLTMDLEKNVLEEVRRGHFDAAADLVRQMIDVYEGAGERVAIAQQRVFEVIVIVSRMLHEMGVDVQKLYYQGQTTSYVQLRAETRVLIAGIAEAAARSNGELETGLLLKLKHYIKDHAHEDLSLERLAAVVDRNPFYVSKLFKEQFGMNYIDYLTECRMEAAKQLMLESEMSLKEITFEIGYNDPNYFSRVFKKIVGHSPTDYRKQLLRPTNKKQL